MITDLIARWLLPAMKRASHVANSIDESPKLRASRSGDEFFDGCESINFRVLQLSNGTVIRMNSQRPMEDYQPNIRAPRAPNIFIVKDDETVQDAIVRMLAIHQLEK